MKTREHASRADGAPHALAALFREWHPRLVRYLRRRLGSVDDAEDVAQEAFTRLLEHRPRDARAWLFRVASNIVADRARASAVRERSHVALASDVAEHADADESLVRAETIARVRATLATLGERDRTIVLLHHAGYRYHEIARAAGVAPSSVGSLLTRAHRRFLEAYEERHGDPAREASG